MRAWVSLLLIVPVLAGCASNGPGAPGQPVQDLDIDAIEVPDRGLLNRTLEGAQLLFQAVELPFEHTFALPAGATMVRFVADPLEASTVGVSMAHEETGRRRCNQQPVVGFGQTLLGERSCSSITALDPPGTRWTARATGPNLAPAGEAPDYGTADVRIEFLTRPVDGVAGMLNLSALTHATYELEPTQYLTVESFDGTPLWVEVTLPKGDGPWPTVIASSPYNGELETADRGNTPAMWRYWTQDWAKRGYAAVNVDVRGYGMSGGCVEVWGENEQRDQAFIVDWVAKQHWSDGNVGFYGQSYVGTTPVAAAVQAPEALKAIIAVAPVISAYEDWHYGGVPNGESAGSPVAYQVLTAAPGTPDTQRTDMATFLMYATSGVCDPTLLPLANSPTAEYNEFYEVRDFKKRAHQVKAAVLFTEGFEDANVKSAMIPGWFNEITAPKLGVFGHWLHQHPARMDQEVLFFGWMEQYVKGKDIGFERLPKALVSAEDGHHRTTDQWPPLEGPVAEFGLDFSSGALVNGTGSGSASIDLNPAGTAIAGAGGPGGTLGTSQITLTTRLDQPLPLIAPTLRLSGTLNGENGFVHATLYEDREDGSSRLLTWGRQNLALRNGYDSYEPLAPTMPFTAELPFRPTEHIVAAGSTLRLEVRGVQAGEAVGAAQPQPGNLMLDQDTTLVVPTVPMSAYEPMPISARP